MARLSYRQARPAARMPPQASRRRPPTNSLRERASPATPDHRRALDLPKASARPKEPDHRRALVRPSAEIAHGYDGTELRTKDGLTIQGLLLKQDDPLMMRSMGGITQIIPLNRVGSRRRYQGSLMMSGAQLGLTEQDVADLVAFLSAP